MPGLKLIADSVEGPRRSRATAVYSSMMPIGSAFSLWLPSAPFLMGDWRIMFMFTGIACLSGCVLMLEQFCF